MKDKKDKLHCLVYTYIVPWAINFIGFVIQVMVGAALVFFFHFKEI